MPSPAAESPGPSAHAGAAKDVLLRLSLSARDRPHCRTLEAVRSSIEDALHALTAWFAVDAARAEHVEDLDGVIALVAAARRRAAEELEDLERGLAGVEEELRRERERAIDRVVASQAQLARGEAARAPEAAPFRASVGVPSVHRIWRREAPPIEPPPPAGEDPGPTPDELIASALEIEPVRVGGREPAPDEAPERAHEARLARACLESIANQARLRRPEAGRRWDDVERDESQMLACLDALVALTGPAPYQLGGEPFDLRREVLRFADELHEDEGRAFVCAFVLGCADEEGAIREAVFAIRHRHRACLGAAREALCLASSPAIRGALSGLLHASDAALACLAIDVLGARREASFGDLALLLSHPDSGVAEAAARALGAAHDRDAAAAALEAFARTCDDDRPLLAAIEGLIGLGAESGAALARLRLREAIGGAGAPRGALVDRLVELLALWGSAEDQALIQTAGRGTPRGAAAMGWLGYAGLVPALIEELARENRTRDESAWNRPTEHAAAVALFRILGEDPCDAIPPPGGLVPVEPATNAELWAELWEDKARALDRPVRYRFGRPYSASQSVEEIAGPLADPASRAMAALELRAALGGRASVDTAGWVARQKAEIARAAEIAAGGEGRGGGILGDRLRRRG
ncbi:MAG: hypothetical protein IT372_14610 [Polyangiaceae bacterium]|nr:hypothetical protein [Polyangiaceae bacterium]